ncbi:hypothetical protein [Sphingomonas sp. CROZ-RG-20F-R02-07]|uniref:phage head-tail joining protein n=1 Tax=Sphingomonas sp. CROZ-RG-20F-R02-07 TaxID=2914832 RepID=UPI001F57A0E5|nr:hypothetical protein [Sphingomonas sp. CROZ-RG-20F-R02-07]
MPAPDYAPEIAALRAGLASGEARVESDGDLVIYRSVGDIMKGIAYFERLAASTTARGPACGTTYAAFYND